MERDNDGRQVAVRTALTVNGAAVTALVGVGFSMAGYTPPEFSYARWSFIGAALLIGVGGATWLVITEQTLPWRIFWGVLLGLAVFVVFPLLMRWVSQREVIWVLSQAPQAQAQPQAAPATPEAPPPASPVRQEPRRMLLPEQAATLRRHLYNANFYRYTSVFDVFCSPAAGDSCDFARQFADVFGSLGMHFAVNQQPPSGPNQTGLMISVRDTRRPPEGAVVLKEALEAAGLAARYIPPVAARSVAGRALEFVLYVGPAQDAERPGGG